MDSGVIERAIVETLAYSDVFEYPLRLDELYRYLPVSAELDDVAQALRSLAGLVDEQAGYYFLAGRSQVVETRRRREAHSRPLMRRALRYGAMLGALPFVRMVALTGSLAVLNSTQAADFDYMLVAVPGRVWIARALALLCNRFTRLFGHTLCPNLIVSENRLAWPTHDLYSARELCQMLPITGMDVYRRVLKANAWTQAFLPNALQDRSDMITQTPEQASALQGFLERLLRGKPGDRFERWEMRRKIDRFSHQAGFGAETVFDVDVCQGNFGHHKQWTEAMLASKLSAIEKGV